MTEENVCRFNKFGYCKYGNYCFRYHENNICENGRCPVKSCSLRHPRKCRFFLEFGKCKFGTYCRFGHSSHESKKALEDIDALRKEIKEVNSKIKEKEKEINLKDDELRTLEKCCQTKVIDIEKKYKEKVAKQEQVILELEMKVKDMVKERDDFYTAIGLRDMEYLDLKERMKNKYGFDSNDEESEYESDDNIEEALNKTNNCEFCEFVGKTKSGLKSHITKKHKEK